MSRGNWRDLNKIGVAVLLALAASSAGWLVYEADRSQSAYQHQAKTRAQQHASRAHIAVERGCRLLAPEAERDCIREEYAAARQREHDEYDLQAQLVTSAWTRAMGIAAIIGMAVGIFGIGLIFFTFRETRNANVIAREALEGQLRPWIDFKLLENGALEIVRDNLHLTASVTFENIGSSPALDLTYFATMIFGEEVNPHFEQLVKGFGDVGINWRDKNLFHGEEWPREACAVHLGERKGPVKITYVVVARYRTPFSKTYRFTGKAFDVHPLGQDQYGGLISQGTDIDISKVVGETVRLVARQGFPGFAT